MRALSKRNDEPARASRPWDVDRDGFVIAEGAGLLFLEEREHAMRRGATIHAEIVGYGASADAYHLTQPAPEGEGAQRAMRAALEDARLDPSVIDYVNAHGTSTPAGDLLEVEALRAVFGAHATDGLWISSTKSVTGHLLGAAGGLEAVLSVLSIRDGSSPAPSTWTAPNPPSKASTWSPTKRDGGRCGTCCRTHSDWGDERGADLRGALGEAGPGPDPVRTGFQFCPRREGRSRGFARAPGASAPSAPWISPPGADGEGEPSQQEKAHMLDIYPVILQFISDVGSLVPRIAHHDSRPRSAAAALFGECRFERVRGYLRTRTDTYCCLQHCAS